MSSLPANVAIFWDYENCELPFNADGYSVAGGIRDIAHKYGTIKVFKAYLETKEQTSPRALSIRSELISSGVSIIDCPHNGRKDVADKMLIVDMLAYAMDNPAPATIVLISGDGDFVHAVSLLRLRRYYVVIIAPTQNNMHLSMKHQASEVYDWCSDIIPTPPRAGDTSLNPRNGHGMSRASMSPATISTARALRSTAAPFYPGSPTVIRDRGNRVQHQQRPSDPDNGEGPDRPVRMYDSVAAGFTFGSFYANISAPCTPQGTSRELRPDHSASSSLSALPALPDGSPTSLNALPTPPPAYTGDTPPNDPNTETEASTATSLPPLADPFMELSNTPTESISQRAPSVVQVISTPTPPAREPARDSRRSGSSSGASVHAPPPVTMSRLKDPPPRYEPLVKILEQRRIQGNTRITSSQLGEVLKPADYVSNDITSLKKYTDGAESAGIVILGEGHRHGNRWIALHPSYHGKSRKSSGS